MPSIGTINEEGVNVDLYIPRKCHASNTLIASYDHASIQVQIADIDANGVATGTTKTLCIAGFLRAEGESDHAINRLCITNGIIRGRTGRQKRSLKKKAVKLQKGTKPVVTKKPTATAKGIKKPATAAAAKGSRPTTAAKGSRPATAAVKKPTAKAGGKKPVSKAAPRPEGGAGRGRDAARAGEPQGKPAPRAGEPQGKPAAAEGRGRGRGRGHGGAANAPRAGEPKGKAVAAKKE